MNSPGRDSGPSSPAWGHVSPPVKQLSALLQTCLCSGTTARASVSYLLHPGGPAPRIVLCPGASLVFLCLGATPRPFHFGLVCMRFPSCPLDPLSAERAAPPGLGPAVPNSHTPYLASDRHPASEADGLPEGAAVTPLTGTDTHPWRLAVSPC